LPGLGRPVRGEARVVSGDSGCESGEENAGASGTLNRAAMSNRRRPRRSGRRTGQPQVSTTALAGTLEEACEQLLGDLRAQGRLLFADAPSLGSLGAALLQDMRTTGPVLPDSDLPVPLPVVLVEPLQTFRPLPLPGAGEIGQPTYDLRVSVTAKLGLALCTGSQTSPATADDWTFHYARPRCSLTDPTGTLIASFNVPHQAAWLKAARSHGKITLIYGPSIGVRRPDHLPTSLYDDGARAAELMRSCQEGTVTWGTIQFRT
jgi:hypothetical protein